MITRIILENYMSHARTVIEPGKGLTALIGPNNCGKSAVVSALQTLCYCRTGGFMVRHGEKQSAVTIETDNGHILTWRRKGNTVSYVIDGREIHRVGHSPPDDLHEHLRLPRVTSVDGSVEFDIHFAEQKSPIFLLTESENRAATFFASSSDAEKLLEMQRLHRDQVAQAKSDVKRLTKETEGLEQSLSILAPVPELASEFAEIDAEHTRLNTHADAAEKLQQDLAVRNACMARLDTYKKLSGATEDLREPPKLQDAPALATAIIKLAEADNRARRETARSRALIPLEVPPTMADVESLERAVQKLTGARDLLKRTDRIRTALEPLKEQPAQEDLAPMTKMLSDFRDALRRQDRAARRNESLATLTALPEVRDPSGLTEFVGRWQKASRTAEQRRAALIAADRELAETKLQIESWAAENPFCPVCRAPLDADHLISWEFEHGGATHE